MTFGRRRYVEQMDSGYIVGNLSSDLREGEVRFETCVEAQDWADEELTEGRDLGNDIVVAYQFEDGSRHIVLFRSQNGEWAHNYEEHDDETFEDAFTAYHELIREIHEMAKRRGMTEDVMANLANVYHAIIVGGTTSINARFNARVIHELREIFSSEHGIWRYLDVVS